MKVLIVRDSIYGFIVMDREGPLKEGELERAQACAREWANKTTQS